MPDPMLDTPDMPAALPADAPVAAPVTKPPKPPAGADDTEIAAYLKACLAISKRAQQDRLPGWRQNVEDRIGRPLKRGRGEVTPETVIDGQATVNPDWSLTKTKTANLYSQDPAVQLTHENAQYAAAIAPFSKNLNYEIGRKRARVGVAIEESLNDVVNASGIAAVMVGYAARFRTQRVPVQDVSMIPPEQLQPLIASGRLPMKDVSVPSDYRFFATRLSPNTILAPEDFAGSDFDDADFIGHSDGMNWAEAKSEFRLTDAQKDDAIGGGDPTRREQSLNVNEQDATRKQGFERVTYDEVFYWRYRVDPDEQSFSAIWRLVYVHGIAEPVIHEPWKGQEMLPNGKYIGACKYPIRICTLTYISDNPFPPSDTEAGRPQASDLRRSRKQMFDNREWSKPLRWFDVNRIPIELQDAIAKGTHQGLIPTNGDGTRSIGEIARASYPAENLAFDKQTKADLMENWQLGAVQTGGASAGEQTAKEVTTTQANFATRIGQERAKVASFFLGIVEVIAGLSVLFSDFPILSDQERQAMQQAWNQKAILHDLVFKIRPDATILLDSNQELKRLYTFLNMTGTSGMVNIMPIMVKMAELSGLDAAEIIHPPTPPADPKPNISFRFSGKDDLMSPIVLAILAKNGEMPSPQELEAAKQVLMANLNPPMPAVPAPPGPAGAGAPGAPGAPPTADTSHPGGMPDKIMNRARDANESQAA